ncbi:hypothetical protein FIBSPDRAFT_914038 [Athelia psychrophila]|uniref:CxC2-like cysteine cluster KDZ transposase-associated domain-containing protein n=1 Tax=Athelia psychrophila TaxID=1759441 RepID=A0A165YKS5_9AGAM|nr:hypothetical protein FIBSPDRAFT_914038 [Fibularhizoctonia sp. CBS 109695]
MPTAPTSPTVGFSMKTLEFYCAAHFRCPQFSIQAFVRTMADLQGAQYQWYRVRQFSIAYDLYLSIQADVDARVNRTLNHEDPDFNIRHVCPPCMYMLKDEPRMTFSMLSAMDGNDSLKCFERHAIPDEDGPALGDSVETIDSKTIPGKMYLTRATVDKYGHSGGGTIYLIWKSVLLPILGTNLTLVDMYCTGEQSKYGITTTERLIDTHRPNQGSGLDIRCSLRITLDNSPLGSCARELNHTILVDAFHGHAHNHLCQLSHLTTYVHGLGLNALGMCKQAFSKSNPHAGSTRSMSTFHHKQAISEHFRNTDDYENYQTMSVYVYTMYKKAHEILKDTPAALEISKQQLGIAGMDGIMEQWLLEEKAYLQNLEKEPPEETLQMEYYQRLMHLWQCNELLVGVLGVGFHAVDPTARDGTSTIETRRRHIMENRENAPAYVQNLELCLGILELWTLNSEEYQETACLVAMCDYQCVLDTLEGLVVVHIFELASMNRAGMGYKMRKHIGKALQSCSAAIGATIERYNTAARVLNPPREPIEDGDVFEATFLSEFDLLRDTCEDIRQRLWATPAGRLAMDQHFKIICAHEEIIHYYIEVRRIVTQLRDEAHFLHHHEDHLICAKDPVLAHQVAIHQRIRGRFDGHHRSHLTLIAKLPGFSGTLELGESLDTGPGGDEGPSAGEIELENEQLDDEMEAQEDDEEVDLLVVMMDKAVISET